MLERDANPSQKTQVDAQRNTIAHNGTKANRDEAERKVLSTPGAANRLQTCTHIISGTARAMH